MQWHKDTDGEATGMCRNPQQAYLFVTSTSCLTPNKKINVVPVTLLTLILSSKLPTLQGFVAICSLDLAQ